MKGLWWTKKKEKKKSKNYSRNRKRSNKKSHLARHNVSNSLRHQQPEHTNKNAHHAPGSLIGTTCVHCLQWSLLSAHAQNHKEMIHLFVLRHSPMVVNRSDYGNDQFGHQLRPDAQTSWWSVVGYFGPTKGNVEPRINYGDLLPTAEVSKSLQIVSLILLKFPKFSLKSSEISRQREHERFVANLESHWEMVVF